MSSTKLLVGLGLGAGALVGYNYFRKLSLTDQHMEIIPSAMIHKLDLTGLHIRMDIRIKNPDEATFKIKYPFMKLVYEGETIGSSQAIDKDILIPPNGEVVINGVMIQIPITNIFTNAYKIFKDVSAGKKVKLKIHTHSTINLGWKTLPFDKVNEFDLKK
jgi:hypothetical protein